MSSEKIETNVIAEKPKETMKQTKQTFFGKYKWLILLVVLCLILIWVLTSCKEGEAFGLGGLETISEKFAGMNTPTNPSVYGKITRQWSNVFQ